MHHSFILLDRSGSMETQWTEAINSVNLYVEELAKSDENNGVTLAVFDAIVGRLSFEIVRDRIIPKTWRKVSPTEVTPRGGTPLNDAIGEIVALADKGTYDKVAIVVMTDGQENSSRELSGRAAAALLDRCRGKNWQVIFLGANFDNTTQAHSYNNAARNTVFSTTANLAGTMRSTGQKTAEYFSGAKGEVAFDEAEKDAAKTDAPTP